MTLRVGRSGSNEMNFLPVQIAQPHPAPFGQRMRRMTNEHQFITPEIFDDQARALCRERHQPEVRIAIEHLCVNLRGTAVVDLHVHLRVQDAELLQERRQLVQADAVDRGDAQFARHDVLQFPDAVAEALEGVQDFLARFEQCAPFLGHGEILLAALDQADVKALLQSPDLLTDRALRDRVEIGRPGEAGGFNEVAEDLESLDLHSERAAS